jgi:hypothetical protein
MYSNFNFVGEQVYCAWILQSKDSAYLMAIFLSVKGRLWATKWQ